MKDLIKFVKMMKYSLQAKMITILAIIFLVIGIFFEFTDFGRGSMFSLAALYLALTSMYFYQMVFTTTVSRMVQTSPLKRKLQTSGPAIITLITSLIAFTLYTVIRCVRMTPEFVEENEMTWAQAYAPIFFMAVSIFVFMVYLGISYKSFIFSLVLIAVSVGGLMFLGGQDSVFESITEKLLVDNGPVLLIAVSYGIIVISAVVAYVLSVLLYKKDISEAAVRYALRQAQSK